MIELIGWIGAISFAICAIPQMYQCYITKSAKGISEYFISLWLTGEIFTVIYLIGKDIFTWPLIFNYSFNFLSLLVIIRYKYNDLQKR